MRNSDEGERLWGAEKREEKEKNSNFPYLHHQSHCIVAKLRKCHRANIQSTDDASACALMCILINHVDVAADSELYRADVTCDHCDKPSNRHAAAVDVPSSCDDNGFRWHDFVYVVTSYTAVPVDPLGNMSPSEDTPATLTMKLLPGMEREKLWKY